jgi:hypothetical protein
MAHHRYLLIYPDGSSKHISREKRDSLLLSQTAIQAGVDRYRYTGKVKIFHSLQELKELFGDTEERLLRKFLEGQFVVEFKGKRYHERLETAEALALRYSQQIGV